MSGGTPVGGGGYVRQRHSQGYSSNGEEDLEDDASSRGNHVFSSPPAVPRGWTWIEITENAIWIASAAFILYFGDWRHNFVFLLVHDNRIRRVPLCLGMIAVALNFLILIYTSTMAWRLRRFDEKWELTSISALPYVTVLGLTAFLLLSFSLWPIWSFLTLPLLFTLFMVCMIVLPSIMIGIFRRKNDSLRVD